MYWKAPTENLICGDQDGNISWQASALTPNRTAPKGDASRRSWMGRLPVPGTGAYEWDGFRKDLPRELNPPRGFIATANNNIHPPGFTPPVMFKSSTNVPFDRITRLLQIIKPEQKYTIDDHRRMQGDALSLRAASEVPLFRGWTSANPEVEKARALIAQWDGTLARDSAAAAIHSAWRTASSTQERETSRPVAERKPQHEAEPRESDRATQGQSGRRLVRLALGPHAHARIPTSAGAGLRPADGGASWRHRHGCR